MGFFDKFNPFGKKNDLGLPPIEGGHGLGEAPFDNKLSHETNSTLGQVPVDPAANLNNPVQPLHTSSSPQPLSNPTTPQPLNDHRMSMPLGENIRQEHRGGTMHGQPQHYEDQNQQHRNPLQKDLDLISTKLDYLKASLEAINQRLANLEHLTRQEQEKNKGW